MASSSTSTEEGIDKVLSLLASRACGGATNDEVEAAIEEILGSRGGSRPPAAPAAAAHGTTTVPATGARRIEQDTGDYDDESTPLESVVEKDSLTPAEPVKKRGRGRPRKAPTPAILNAIVLERYDDTPLGRQGAKMMVAFGDGPQPVPSVVARTLLACRQCLHAAIRDARHVRRRHQRWYTDAQRHLPQSTRHKARTMLLSKLPSDSQQFQFRALQPGSDSLSKNALCGFGTDELALLFPEEMCAYQRWTELHEATTTQAAAEDGKESPNVDEDGAASSVAPVESAAQAVELPGGHLQERLEQFDIRTDRMDKDNYLQFSTVRFQGSFLPRRSKGEEERRGSLGPGGATNPVPPPTQGRPAGTSTAQMSSVMVRFLHWLGFDIDGTVADADEESPSNNAPLRLAAPSAETTHALAFLAHDFFGRIVEKAIFWRNVRSDETRVVIELRPGEQLQGSDIERALKDPEIRLEPLYASKGKSDSHAPKPQLYFGPGFEERLEMELEEMVESLTEEERKEREEEERFFAQLAAPPSLERFDSSGLPDTKAPEGEGPTGRPAGLNLAKESDNAKQAETSTRKRKSR
jgi:hypothetical protein